MKAAVLEKQNSPLVIHELIPPPLMCGQVLVDIKTASICGAQIGEITGAAGPDKYLPHLLGHEGAGTVKEVGPGVMNVKPGDHVVLHWRKGIGIEAQPPTYHSLTTDSPVGAGCVASFATSAVVSENRLTTISKGIPFGVAALMGCAVTTGLGLINNEAKLKIGQSIAVAGCGGVGLNVIQGAAMVSAGFVLAIDINQEKLKQAERFGATDISTGTTPDFFSLPEDPGYVGWLDVFVDCTGDPYLIESGLTVIRPGGKLILVGQPKQGELLTINNFRQHYKGKTIMDSQGGLTNPTVDIPRYLNLYKQGKLKLDEQITHRYPLEQINDAMDMVKSGKAGKVILEMD